MGCDIPTDVPIWDTEWRASAGQASLTAADVLPSDVVKIGNSFSLPIFPSTAGLALSRFCTACTAASGPKPAFDAVAVYQPSTPVDVVGGTIIAGEGRFSLRHSWGFDPLRPGGTATGSLSIEIVGQTGDVLGVATLDGAEIDFPSGTTRTLSVPVNGGRLEGGSEIRVRVASPAGADATLDPSAELAVSLLSDSFLLASSVDIRISDAAVESSALAFDLTEVDESVGGSVQRGALVIATGNSLDLGVGGAIEVDPGEGSVIRKALVIPKGTSEQSFELTVEEIQSMLGRLVDVRGKGVVQGGAGQVVTVSPIDRLDVKVDLELSIRIGG